LEVGEMKKPYNKLLKEIHQNIIETGNIFYNIVIKAKLYFV